MEAQCRVRGAIRPFPGGLDAVPEKTTPTSKRGKTKNSTLRPSFFTETATKLMQS